MSEFAPKHDAYTPGCCPFFSLFFFRPLVDFVNATKPSAGALRPAVDRRMLAHWTAALQAAAKENPPVLAAGLRLCVVCGENMATPVRMQQHVRGKRHCAAVAMAHFVAVTTAGGLAAAAHSRPTPEIAKMVLETQSSAPLAAVLPEPPDVAVRQPHHCVSPFRTWFSALPTPHVRCDIHRTCGNACWMLTGACDVMPGSRLQATALRLRLAALPKGERALRAEQPPLVDAPLPDRLRSRRTLQFDSSAIDLRGAVGDLLQRLPSIGAFGPTPEPAADGPAGNNAAGNDGNTSLDRNCASHPGHGAGTGRFELEQFKVTADVFRSFKARQVVYAAVSTDDALLAAYVRLITEVCCPYLKHLLLQRPTRGDTTPAPANGDKATETVFFYQYPPTLRLQPGPSEEHGRKHRDLEYGHQVRTDPPSPLCPHLDPPPTEETRLLLRG